MENQQIAQTPLMVLMFIQMLKNVNVDVDCDVVVDVDVDDDVDVGADLRFVGTGGPVKFFLTV